MSRHQAGRVLLPAMHGQGRGVRRSTHTAYLLHRLVVTAGPLHAVAQEQDAGVRPLQQAPPSSRQGEHTATARRRPAAPPNLQLPPRRQALAPAPSCCHAPDIASRLRPVGGGIGASGGGVKADLGAFRRCRSQGLERRGGSRIGDGVIVPAGARGKNTSLGWGAGGLGTVLEHRKKRKPSGHCTRRL